MFQNGVKAIEEVLEVATYCPKHSFVFFKAEAKELLSEMLPQLTERYSCEGEMQNTICLLRIDTNDQRHAIKRSWFTVSVLFLNAEIVTLLSVYNHFLSQLPFIVTLSLAL